MAMHFHFQIPNDADYGYIKCATTAIEHAANLFRLDFSEICGPADRAISVIGSNSRNRFLAKVMRKKADRRVN